MGAIILFDGDCNFCDHSVRFIMKRDPKQYFQFAALHSQSGERLIRKYQIPTTDSVVLIEREKYYLKSEAALRICRSLEFPWNCLTIFRILPSGICDLLYSFIAHNRYRWFGRKQSCMLPTPEARKRFLK